MPHIAMLVATPKETPTMMPTTMSMVMLYGYAPKLHPQITFVSLGHRGDS